MQERNPIRVVQWGLGEAGLAMANLVWRRPGMMPVGAISNEAGHAGQDLGALLGFGERLGVMVDSDPMGVLTVARPDVTLISVGSSFDETAPLVLQAMEAGSNVICIGEAMTYPWASRPDLAEKLDELAHAHGVSVLGTGMSPGFALDTLAIALTGCCMDVERIRAARIDALTPEEIRTFGIGLSPSHFSERIHLTAGGLEESVHLIADALGWSLDRVETEQRPELAEVRREVEGKRVQPGQVAGFTYAAVGEIEGRPRIFLEYTRQAAPEIEGVALGDFIEIEGTPSLKMAVQPTAPTVKGAAALAVNMIPAVLQAGPGLLTMADLPVPRAILNDARDRIHVRGPSVEEELARGWHEGDGADLARQVARD